MKKPVASVSAAADQLGLAARIRSQAGALTAREVAEYLSLNKSTLYMLVAQGKIPHFRLGSLIRFDPACIADWLEKRMSGVA